MIKGFIVGKFYPLHLGHMYLIDVARAHCDHLTVWVCEKADQSVLGTIRASWIKRLYPDIEVRLVPDTLGDEDTEGWAKYTLRVLGEAPDIVFSSEDYGESYARLMGSKHILVDKRRVNIPISGTKVRNDTLGNWIYLASPVRAYYTKRVVILGAESTGTTTLTKELAEHYQTTWVPEYGREYTSKWVGPDKPWTTDEFIHIASEQSRREDEAARSAHGVLMCDTDAFATSVWHRRYIGTRSPEVEKIALKRHYDLYIITGDEIPFVQDGTRDGEHIRHEMHQWFINDLEKSNRKYIVVRGNKEERLRAAISEIDAILGS